MSINADPDQTPAEYHLYSKYSNRQTGAISVNPDRTPAEYHNSVSIQTGRPELTE